MSGLPRPYPVQVSHRDVASEPPPSGSGLECFETPGARAINKARMEHLGSLGLPLAGKTVLDVGCGVGHLAQYLHGWGAKVTCVDGREENIAHLRTIYPNLPASVADVQRDPLSRFGRFQCVFSYGLLYHLEDPIAGLRNIASVCDEFLMLETLVCDSDQPVMVLIDEPWSVNQALGAVACRPSPGFVTMALNRVGFRYVYGTVRAPDYQDFQFEWKNNLDHWRDGHPIRCIFIASRKPMDDNPNLISLLS